MLTFLFLTACSGSKGTDTGDAGSVTDTSDTSDTSDTNDTGDTPEPGTLTDFTGDIAAVESEINSLYAGSPPVDLLNPDFQDNMTVPGLTGAAYTPIVLVQFSLAFDDDGILDCPFVTGTFDESGYQTTDVLIEGGCTDADGQEWEGSMLYNSFGVYYDNLTLTSPSEDCPSQTSSVTYNGGVLHVPGGLNSSVKFLIDGPNEACEQEVFTMGLNGSLLIDEQGDETTYNGVADVFLADSVFGNPMSMNILTVDELTSSAIDACATEPLSGTNTITAGINTLEFTFDGETDCDEEPTQMLSINGEEAVEVAGTGCSTAGSAKSTTAFVLALLGFFGLRGRRSRIA